MRSSRVPLSLTLLFEHQVDGASGGRNNILSGGGWAIQGNSGRILGGNNLLMRGDTRDYSRESDQSEAASFVDLDSGGFSLLDSTGAGHGAGVGFPRVRRGPVRNRRGRHAGRGRSPVPPLSSPARELGRLVRGQLSKRIDLLRLHRLRLQPSRVALSS